MQRYESPEALHAIERYLDIATAKGVLPEHAALKFCETRPFVTSVILGATTMAQLETDLAATDFPWNDEWESAVNALHACAPNLCP